MAKNNIPNPTASTNVVSFTSFLDNDVFLKDIWDVLPRAYESRAVLQIGKIAQFGPSGQTGYIEQPAVLVKRMVVQHGMENGEPATNQPSSFLHNAHVEKDTNLVSIVARGSTPHAAQEYLSQVIERLMHEHNELFGQARKELQSSLALLQERGHDLKRFIASYEKGTHTMERLPTGAKLPSDLGTYIVVSEKTKLFEQLVHVEQKQMDLRMAMSELQTKPTIVIKTPTLLTELVKPRPLLYFFLAIVIGLAIGVFIAYAMEFLRRPMEFSRRRAGSPE